MLTAHSSSALQAPPTQGAGPGPLQLLMHNGHASAAPARRPEGAPKAVSADRAGCRSPARQSPKLHEASVWKRPH